MKYIYLDDTINHPVIINVNLLEDEEKKVREVLGNFKEVFGHTRGSFEGLTPSFVMHKINLVEDVEPIVEILKNEFIQE